MDGQRRVGGVAADHAIAELAERQHGVVARRQLLGLGLTSDMVEARRRARRLIRLHRGIYAVGHRRLSREGRWMAAVLAAGPSAVLSHRDAAALHGLRRPHSGRIDVTTTGDQRSTREIRVHQTKVLTDADATVVDGIPTTTVARTLLDLAEAVSVQELAAALGEAERRDLLDEPALRSAMERTRGRRGRAHAALAETLARHAEQGAPITRSELEQAFLALLDAARLPRPLTNAYVEGVEVDACWPQRRAIVELDSWEFHRTRSEFERDRAKDAALMAAGWRVMRFTYRQITRDPRTVASRVRALLRRST